MSTGDDGSGDLGWELGRRVADALAAALDVRITPAEALIRPSAPGRGADYQCDVAMGLAKRVGRTPREVATALVEHLDAADLVEPPGIAGPGFVNLTLRRGWLQERTSRLLADERLGVPTVPARRIAIDYGGPDVAEEMHVGHLRSAIIGDAIARMLEFAGHEVIRRNHLGDWCAPFGMLIEHLLDRGVADCGRHTIGDLDGFHRAARRKFDDDPGFADRARRRVVALRSGDVTALEPWRALVAESERHVAAVHDLLGVRLTAGDTHGESFHDPVLADTAAELDAAGLTEVSAAVCAFPPGSANRDGDLPPLVVREGDGGYGYASTDLAAVRHWTRERGATDLLYVAGLPRARHFAMVFATARAAGWLDGGHRATHVGFGSVLGEDGKLLPTRAGASITLVELLREAVDHAAATTGDAAAARAAGIGAVKYAHLSADREKDCTSTWKRMLSFTGNTSVHLQFANVRALSLLAAAGREPAPGTPVVLAVPAERALALKILQLPAALDAAIDGHAPHKLCTHLYETAVAFSSFYESCAITRAPDEATRASRSVLVRLTSRVLVLGLSLLGIEAPDRL